jgi:hypothetical protein
MGRKRRRVLIIGGFLLVLYVGPYVGLSRRGYAEARQNHMVGFYYFIPEDSDFWRLRNYFCVLVFYPLNIVDRCLGTGEPPAKEPLSGLSR